MDTNNLIVYCEFEEGNIADVSLELLTKGRSLANQLGVRLEAIVLGDNLEGIEKQIFHVRIRQGAGVPAPAQIPHDVHPVSQEVQPDGVPQQRVMAEHRPAVADGVGGLALLRDGEVFPHLVNALLRR